LRQHKDAVLGRRRAERPANAAVQQVNLDLTDAADLEYGRTLDLACSRNSTVYRAA
jgi:hypothetical protein